MAATGGPITDISIKGRLFPIAADAESNRKIGGMENELEMNGDGVTGRVVQTLVAWMVDGLTVSYDDDKGDLEFLQDIVDSAEIVAMTVTFASGSTWGGRGTITGELQASSKNSTVPVTLSGPGKLEQQ